MNPTTPPPVLESAPGYRINALTGAATGTSRDLSAPLSAEITAALTASPSGEIAVRSVDVNIPLLEKNDILAERNRGYFLGRGLAALNLVSSPGAGKTTLLERTLDEFGRQTRCAVSWVTSRRTTTAAASAGHTPRSPRSPPAPSATSTPA